MSPYDILYLLFRNRWLVLMGLVAGLAAAAVTYHRRPPTYRSEARLLVRYVTDTAMVDPEISGERVLVPGRPADTVMSTELGILTSPDLVATAARRLAQDAGAGTNGGAMATATTLARGLTVEAPKNSSTIHLRLQGADADLTRRALTHLIDAYLEKHQEVHRHPGAFEFIARQADEMRARLTDAEDELRRLRNQAGIVTLTESRQLAMMRIGDLDRELREAESALAATRARMQSLAAQPRPSATNGTPAETAVDEAAETLPVAMDTVLRPSSEVLEAMQRLTELKRRESILLLTYTPSSVPVLSVRRQITALQDEIGIPAPQPLADNGSQPQPVMTTPGRTAADALFLQYATYRADEAGLAARQEVLSKRMESAQAEAERIEASEAQITRLDRTRETFENNYRYFSQRLEQARIENALQASKVSNIAIVQPPTLPLLPEYGELLKLLGMLVAGGAGLGVALAVAREYLLDHRIRHAHEMQRLLRVPFLAALPFVPLGRKAGTGPRHKAQLREMDAACEIVAQLIHARVEKQQHALIVGFTAPHHGVGVSTIVERVASAMQHSGRGAVLVATVSAQGQFVAKVLGELVGVAADDTPNSSFDDGARTGSDTQLPVKVSYAKPVPVSPDMFANLGDGNYDCVLVDLPPLSDSDIAVRLLPRVHGVVLVTENLRTTRGQALACIERANQLHGMVYGTILNKYRTCVPTWVMSPPTAIPPPSAVPPRPA